MRAPQWGDLSTEIAAPVVPSSRPASPHAAGACIVLLGGRLFAVDVANAREVVMLDTTTAVPGAPSAVLGVMNLRGSVLPVVEARPLLGLPVGTRCDRALVIDEGGCHAAVVIEGVVGLSRLDAVEPVPDTGLLVRGELALETGGRAGLLDARALLAAIRRPWASPGGQAGG
jgi:purine-binding chemotaxis protein CheW